MPWLRPTPPSPSARATSKWANRELAVSNAELAELADVVSRDLSEPLHTITECTHLITMTLADEVGPETTESLDLITSSVARMRQLIDDLVTYSASTPTHTRSPPSPSGTWSATSSATCA